MDKSLWVYIVLKKFSRSIILVMLFYLSSLKGACGQIQFKNDSLKFSSQIESREQKFEALVRLYSTQSSTDYDAALKYANLAFQESLSLGDTIFFVRGGRMVANTLLSLRRFKDAEKLYNKLLAVAYRNELTNQITYLSNSLGLLYVQQGNFSKALGYHLESLIRRVDEGDLKNISIAQNNIGSVYERLGDYKLALYYFFEAKKNKLKCGDQYGLDQLHSNIGYCYFGLKDYQESINYFNQALSICGGKCSNDSYKESFSGLGYSYLKCGQYDYAKLYLDKSLLIAMSQHDDVTQIADRCGLAEWHMSFGRDLDRAKVELDAASRLEAQGKYTYPLADIYRGLIRFYSLRMDYKNASFYQAKYIQIKDSLNRGLLVDISKISSDFNQKENKRIIAYQRQILDLKEDSIMSHRIFIVLIVAVLMLFIIISLMLFRLNRIRLRNNNILDSKVTERTDFLESRLRVEKMRYDERYQRLKSITLGIHAPLATLSGLIGVAIADIDDLESSKAAVLKMNFVMTEVISKIKFVMDDDSQTNLDS